MFPGSSPAPPSQAGPVLAWSTELADLVYPQINAAQEPGMGQLEPSACGKAKHLSVHARYLALGLIILKYKSRHYLATIYNRLHVQCQQRNFSTGT